MSEVSEGIILGDDGTRRCWWCGEDELYRDYHDREWGLAKELKARGFKFVGPTTAYAFMQAMGLVNDHLEGCDIRREVEGRRSR